MIATLTSQVVKKVPARCSVCNLFVKKERLIEKTWRGLKHLICLSCLKRRERQRRRIENRILLGVIALCILSIIYSLTDIYGR